MLSFLYINACLLEYIWFCLSLLFPFISHLFPFNAWIGYVPARLMLVRPSDFALCYTFSSTAFVFLDVNNNVAYAVGGAELRAAQSTFVWENQCWNIFVSATEVT